MTKRTVQSPAGETIEIVSDEDWQALTGSTRQTITLWQPRRPILGALWTHGEFTDRTGQASKRLIEFARQYGYAAGTNRDIPSSALSGMFRGAVFQPAVEREIRGKRCFSVKLVAMPEAWFKRLDAEWPHVNGATAATATAAPVDREEYAAEVVKMARDEPSRYIAPDAPLLPAEPPTEYVPPIDLDVASSVAMAMLTQVVEIISAGSQDIGKVRRLQADLTQASDLLAKRLEENAAMRKSIRDLGEEVAALRYERDGLLKRLRATEANLEHATNPDMMRIVNERVQAELAKVMRAAPASPKGTDDAP